MSYAVVSKLNTGMIKCRMPLLGANPSTIVVCTILKAEMAAQHTKKTQMGGLKWSPPIFH